jgi:putative ABC transport system permease protein
MPAPPRLAERLLERTVPEQAREFLLGDLREQFSHRAASGVGRARRWYWRQALGAVWHLARSRRHAASNPHTQPGDSEMRQTVTDLGYALRILVRQPFYAAVAALSLAIAIGANGLVFGLVDNLVLNPFQFPNAGTLVSIGSTFPRLNADEGFIEQHSPAEIEDFRRASSLVNLAAFDLGNRAVSNGVTSERVFTVLAVDDPLPAMGQPAALGRGFAADELTPGGPMVAIISHRLWSSLFGADPQIVGKTIQVNSQSRTVVGVTAPGSTLLGADLWIPLGLAPSGYPRNRRQFTLVARLAPGASIDDANAELATIAARTVSQYGDQFPEYEGWRLRIATWTEAVTGQAMGPARILIGAGILVLLIACANLTSLMLTRLNVRRREIVLRYALGAGGWQVTRLLLFESLAIAAAATATGLLLARAILPSIVGLLPARIANMGQPEIDLRVAGYAALVGLLAAAVTTVAPVWQARRASLGGVLKDGATTTGGRQRLRQTLVVAELTLAVVLLVGAGLLLRSYARIQQIDPGFRTDHLLTMRLTLAWERFSSPGAAQQFFHEFVSRLRELPEVEHAAATSQFPPEQPFSLQFRIEGAPETGDTLPTALLTTVTPGYFDVMGIPVLNGRPLDESDRPDRPDVAVVNEAFVDRHLDGRPTGRILIGGETTVDIVGVVANTRNNSLLRPPVPEIFATIDQAPGNNQLFLVVRTTTDPQSALPAVRRALAEMDPDQPLYLIQTMDEALAGSVSSQRIGLTLVGAFAAAALVIACVGVYGIIAYWVSTRSREIGIRMALGASARQVTGLVARQTVRLVAIGAGLGVTAGIALARLAESQLYETSATDPVALAGVTFVLAVVGIAAGYVPSRRAAGVDPVDVLRAE